MDTKQQHTAEPWHETGTNPPMIYGANGDAIAQCDSSIDNLHRAAEKANARRIVACVNACAGIETEVLERHTLGMIAAGNSQQRDELLRARQVLGAEITRLQAMNEALVKQIADGIALQPPAPVHLHGDAAEAFRMREQRDKLLAALKEAVNQLDTLQGSHKERWSNERTNMVSAARVQARSIIAEIEAAQP